MPGHPEPDDRGRGRPAFAAAAVAGLVLCLLTLGAGPRGETDRESKQILAGAKALYRQGMLDQSERLVKSVLARTPRSRAADRLLRKIRAARQTQKTVAEKRERERQARRKAEEERRRAEEAEARRRVREVIARESWERAGEEAEARRAIARIREKAQKGAGERERTVSRDPKGIPDAGTEEPASAEVRPGLGRAGEGSVPGIGTRPVQRFASAGGAKDDTLHRAQRLFAMGRFEDSLSLLRSAEATGTEGTLGALLRDRLVRLIGERSKMLAEQQEALSGAPDNVDLRFALGYLYLERSRYADAIETYQGLLKTTPRDRHALINLGYACRMDGDFEGAEGAYRECIAISPGTPEGYNHLAYLYALNDRKLKEAEGLALKAHELAPRDADILDTLGLIRLKRGDPESALGFLSRAASRSELEEVQYHKGLALAKAGRTGAARRIFERLRDQNGEYAPQAARALTELIGQGTP